MRDDEGDVELGEQMVIWRFSRLPAPVSRKPLANGLWSILSFVTRSFWYAVTAMNSVSLNT